MISELAASILSCVAARSEESELSIASSFLLTYISYQYFHYFQSLLVEWFYLLEHQRMALLQLLWRGIKDKIQSTWSSFTLFWLDLCFMLTCALKIKMMLFEMISLQTFDNLLKEKYFIYNFRVTWWTNMCYWLFEGNKGFRLWF